ncbi:hypothetical protein RHGRI_006741 [Rhododendron griersonianum]|uniref:Pentatricopeptide repeat-containing protein n=1 Tax=Rhododendron griersonianum TaxID=479676 RepID=A0AAV6KVX3_9ERIC|nr:hypothetical protein RHGRI_006741 [Rhododendron griersonianum]
MHGFAIENGLYHSVVQTSLLDFYAKCGDMEREVHGNQKSRGIRSKMASSWIWNPVMLAITLSTVQAVVERWDGVEELRRCMNNNDLMKKPGWSCVEAKGLIHGFDSGDRQLPQILEIYEPMDVICRN